MEFDRYLDIRKSIMKKQVDKFDGISKQELIHVCFKFFESEQRLQHLLNAGAFMREYDCEWIEGTK